MNAFDRDRPYNRVLMQGLPLREHAPASPHKRTVDGSLLQFVVEELIAASALEVLVSGSGNASSFVDMVPGPLKKRVRLLDTTKERQQGDALFCPVAEEFSIKLSHGGLSFQANTFEDHGEAFANIYFALEPLLIGINHEVEIDIDLAHVLQSVRAVRSQSRNPAARGILATLEGILGSYRAEFVPGLRAIPDSRSALVEAFVNLVEDQQYRDLSRNANWLGVPERSKRAITLMKRNVSALLRKRPFKQIFSFGSEAIEMATQIPIPGSEDAESLLATGFLPPIIDIRSPLARAVENWKAADTELIPPPRAEAKR